MDLEELRCLSQVNGNYTENKFLEQSFYNGEYDFPDFDEPVLDLTLLAPCEFCNRTFIPTSLNKHKKVCYKSWLKVKERESKMSNDPEKSFQANGYHGEKPIMTIEQMLAKRRQRRLNWRLRHEEFMRAVHAAREYAEAVASGNPLPPPPPPIVEPDLRQCPHCQRKFHEKSIDRHIIRCKEQSIRNNKERPSYQTMEAKRRLAVRLYYQPNSRPNSSLSMTNSEPPTNFSRPSSRQTDFDYGRNVESSNSYNIGRHSSLSIMDRNETKPKIPTSFLDNLSRSYERHTPRHSFKDFRNSQNNTPTYNYRMSTPNIAEHIQNGRKSNISMALSRNSSRQSMIGNSSEIEFSQKKKNDFQSLNSDPYAFRRNIKRSTSCISQLHASSGTKIEKRFDDSPVKSDIKIYNHKPFSCNRSSIKDVKVSKEMSKSNSQINKVSDIERSVSRTRLKDVKHRTSSRHNEPILVSTQSSRPCSSIDKSDISSHSIIIKSSSRAPRGNSHMKLDTHVNETPVKNHSKSKSSSKNKKENPKVEESRNVHKEIVSSIPAATERSIVNHEKHRVQQNLKVSNSEININTIKSDHGKLSSTSTENLKAVVKHQSENPIPGNRVRNEIQIRIKSHTQSEVTDKSKDIVKETSKKIVTSNSIHNSKETSQSCVIVSPNIENEKLFSNFRQIDSKGEGPSPPQSSFRIVSNSNISKIREQAQGDNTYISPKSVSVSDENRNSKVSSLNLYQYKSIKSVSISDQNNMAKYKSTISLQDSLIRSEENQIRIIKSNDLGHFCHECGHRFPGLDAKFCCSCGSKRSEIILQK